MDTNLSEYLTDTAETLEKKRKKLIFLNKLYSIIVKPLKTISALVLFLLFLSSLIFPLNWIAVIIMLAITTGLRLIPTPNKIYKKHIKTKILPAIFKEVNDQYTYEPYTLNKDLLEASGIFNKSFFSKSSKITGEDFVHGTINSIDLSFNEVSFFKEKVDYGSTALGCLFGILSSDEETEIEKKEVKHYSCMFMYADFHKHFDGEVLMIPKTVEKLADKLSDAFHGTRFKKINIENGLLNDQYNIYCTDEQEAFYILSPKILESIYDIFLKEEVTPVMTFKKGKMYMALPWTRDYFNTQLNKKVVGKEYFTLFINEILSFEKMVNHFDLNTRIWTKE